MSWQDDLPPIPAERIRDAVMDQGARRVRRRRQLGAGISLAVLLLVGLTAVAVQSGDRKPTQNAAGGPTTTAPTEIPADAQGSSSVSGAVSVGGRPLAGATVEVSNDPCCVHRYAYAGPDGRYSVTGLPAGTYTIGFSGGGARYSWYMDKSTAAEAGRVTLAEGEQRSGINGTLIAGAGISGKVTSDKGALLSGIWVYFNGQQDYGHVETRADGTYSISDIPPGDYTLQFDPGPPKLPYIPEYYNNKAETATADHIHLVDGQQVTGINAALTSAAR